MVAIKLALTIPADVVARAKKEVATLRAKSLSAYVSEAVAEKLRRDDLVRMLDAMDRELGVPRAAAKQWAKRILKRSS